MSSVTTRRQTILPSSHTRWSVSVLLHLACLWCDKQKKHHRFDDEYCCDWWWFIACVNAKLPLWVQRFITGKHHFEPVRRYHFSDEVVDTWVYLDKLMIHLLFRILRPTFKHLIPVTCVSTQGPNAIKAVTDDIKTALQTGDYTHALRIDIKSYYASIDRAILLEQLHKQYDDPIVKGYLEAIVFHSIDDNGNVFVPKKGIPLRSSLSPFFGALYLAPLDLAFESMNVFYRRYVDDMIILVKSHHQYTKAKRRLFNVLRQLKLVCSPQKTKMGKLKDFHFLGVTFEVSQNAQSNKNQVSATMHKRSCSRALDKVKAMKDNAVDAATIQRYLSLWATWWQFIGNWDKLSILAQWFEYAAQHKQSCAWYVKLLIAFEERLRPTPNTATQVSPR